MEIGERLKEAREAANLSLESLQENTKIQKRYLEAIEQGNFHILPGKFYARAFIKEYANAVGLDPNQLLEEYKEELPQQEEETSAEYTQIHRSRKDGNPTKNTAIFSFIPTVIVVLLIVGILFAAYYFYQQTLSDKSTEPVDQQDDNEVIYSPDEEEQSNGGTGDDNINSDTDSNSDSGEEENTDSQAEEPEPELTVTEKGTGSSPESTLTLKNASDKVIVTMSATGDSWLEVKTGSGKSLYSDMFTTKDSPLEFDLSDEERVWFNVGSAPSLDIYVDGVKLVYPVNAEEKVHQYLWVNINRASE